MEDIGCHFKFENLLGKLYQDTDLLLSSGRNCLRFIIRERKITTLFLPYFLCESLADAALLENVEVIFYHVNEEMLPVGINSNMLNNHCYLYFVNYYGLLRDRINEIIGCYKYVIVDNTHDFFDSNKYNADTIYNYRKYFGVPDGACIMSKDLKYNPKYEQGKSLNKIIEMISRDETGNYFHYPTFKEADKHFANEDLCYMSNFTKNYLRAIDYKYIYKKRLENYKVLSKRLAQLNEKEDINNKSLSYMYPFYYEDGIGLRDYLLERNIYSQLLWPNVKWNGSNESEIRIAEKAVLLPIDQRYSEVEMNYISDTVNSYIRKAHK